tara:strand:- start:1617 stop:1850 length:234 start_codon:yes stop_codon:yes gene_type:complete
MNADRRKELGEAWNDASDYQTELTILRDKIGRLDDVIESPYIDDRANVGAYQSLIKAGIALENFMWLIEAELGEVSD